MLLREVEYAKPASVADALSALAARLGVAVTVVRVAADKRRLLRGRLLRRTRIAVSILNSSGAVVASLLRPRQFGLRVVRLVWNGREAPRASLAPTGHYFPEVFFPRLHRSLRLPSAITLDRVEPVIRRASLRRRGTEIIVRYSFSEPAQAVLLADGRRAVVTRFAPTAGIVRWGGRFASGRLLSAATHTLELVAVDPAGNRSRPTLLGQLRGA